MALSPLVIGSFGVTLLLVAFLLNILGKLEEHSLSYLFMNFLGAALAAWYAVESRIVPFVILEGVWSLSALTRILLRLKKGPLSS